MNIISALLLFLSILFIIIFLYILFTNDNKIIKFRITKEQIPELRAYQIKEIISNRK